MSAAFEVRYSDAAREDLFRLKKVKSILEKKKKKAKEKRQEMAGSVNKYPG